MKRNLKNICLFAIAIIVGCLCIPHVSAETRYGSAHTGGVTLNVTMTDKSSDTSKTYGNYGQYVEQVINGEGVPGQWYGDDLPFYLHYEYGTGLEMYCLDANLSGARLNLMARRFMASDDVYDSVYTLDLALMHVYLSDANYEIKSVVIRALTALWNSARSGSYQGITQGTLALSKAYYGLAYTWLTSGDDALLNNYYTLLGEFSGQYYLTLQELQNRSEGYRFNIGFTGEGEAKRLFAEALEVAADYINNEGPDVTTAVGAESDTTYSVDTDQVGELHTFRVVQEFTLNNFTNDGEASFVIDSLSYDQSLETLGVPTQPSIVGISINGDDLTEVYNDNFIGINLLFPLVNTSTITDEITLSITIEFVGYESVVEEYQDIYPTLRCGEQPMSWTLNYTYSDSAMTNQFDGYLGIVWEAVNADDEYAGFQRFITVEPLADYEADDNSKTGTVEGSLYLTNECGDCDELIEACIESGDYESDECDELRAANCDDCDVWDMECNIFDIEEACDNYDEFCTYREEDPDVCSTTIDMFECCDAEGELLLISQYDDNSSTHPVSITGPDADVCFVDIVDNQVANNNGNASDVAGMVDDVDNSYTLMQNRYCVVSCKEDYIMEMPTAKLVNAGRYFTFSAAVDGTKTCYTNSIGIDKYNEDIENLVEEMEEAFNEYSKYVTAMEVLGSNEGINLQKYIRITGGCGACNSDGYYQGLITRVEYYTYSFETAYESTNNLVAVRRVSRNSNPSYYNFERDYAFDSVSEARRYFENSSGSPELMDDGGYDGGCGSCGCCGSGCPAGACKPQSIAGANGYYSNVSHNLEVLRDYWKQRYEELEDELADLQMQFEDCGNGYWTSAMNYDPEIYYDYEEDYLATHYRDYGRMDSVVNNVTTDQEWYCQKDSLGNGGYNEEDCDSSTVYADTQVQNVVCDLDALSCTLSDPFDLPIVQYVKKTSSINVGYRPATLFYNEYPSGNVGKYDEEGGDTLPANSVALENSLPVALDTKRGIYEYSIKIDNLGEYYDIGETGRLIGDDNPVINQEDYSEFFDEDGNVQYICAYLVNMGTIDDDFQVICDWDNCEDGDCTSNCVGPNCDEICYGDDCISNCIGAGCLYDADAGQHYNERIVSLNNMFPNGTNSYNWTNAKGEETVDEIENEGDDPEAIFDEDPILSVTIDRNTNAAILEYNERADNGDGGYSNASLTCTSVGGYEMIGCYSTFIDDLIAGRLRYGNSVINSNLGDVVNDRSMILSGNYRDNSSNYFELWSNVNADQMMGPSWK